MNHHDLIRLYFEEAARIATSMDAASISELVNAVLRCYDHDGTVYVCANGGPAGAAESFAADLRTHPFVTEDKSVTTSMRRLRVVCLSESAAMVTGISNDLGFEHVFVEQLKNYLRSSAVNGNDVLIAFSGSGNSGNVLRAIAFAREFAVTTACIAGRGGGRARVAADICVLVPGSSRFPGQTGPNDNNFHIEDFQMAVTHIVTGLLKQHAQQAFTDV